jgi:hypothetical protein
MEDNNIETLDTNTPIQSVEPTPVAPVQEPTPIPVAPQPVRPETATIPANYAPISAWGYVGYELLFCIPVVGFILMLVFAFNNSNINRKNFARSYLIYFIFGLILTILGVVLAAVFGYSLTSLIYN